MNCFKCHGETRDYCVIDERTYCLECGIMIYNMNKRTIEQQIIEELARHDREDNKQQADKWSR
jgi:hypothetical protein